MLSASKSGNALLGGYNLQRSLRFRASASAYLSRTPASAGNRSVWTWSGWVKKSQILADGTDQTLFCAYSGSGTTQQTGIQYSSYSPSGIIDSIRIQSGTYGVSQDFDFGFANTYRDPSSWYHVIVAFDTTQATASNRIKVYVNGNQLGSPVSYAGRATTVSQNYQTAINSNISHNISRFVPNSNYFDGYFAEVNFIDGQALTPSSFGSFNNVTGVWQPAPYTGTYGTNGFYLPFTDNSALTTSSNVGLGKDFSGNGNYWTTNNISITAGVTYDSMTDVPTLTSATASNFAVLNPLSTNATLTDGNLATWSPITQCGACSTISIPNAKIYFEVIPNSTPASLHVGVIAENPTIAQLSTTANADSVLYRGDGGIFRNTGSGFIQVQTVSSYTNGDVISCAVDMINRTVQYYKNNTAVGTAVSLTSGIVYTAWLTFGSTSVGSTINFGQQPFTYTPPTGFVALNTYNLSNPLIPAGNQYMDATLYTGDGTTGRTITNAAAFQPDLVWIKSRSNALNNNLYDSVRGAPLELCSNNTAADSSGDLTAFASNGFTINQTTSYELNHSGYTYVAWQWRAGAGTTSTNTSGTITSTTSVNAAAGFSVVTWTYNSSGGTIGHGLGIAPQLIIQKDRTNGTYNWDVYHVSLGATQRLSLNSTNATQSQIVWNNTAPTSSVFSSGASWYTNGDAIVSYCFTPIAGYSAFGSYIGNGSADGTFVYTGFRPKYILIKRTDAAGYSWCIYDTARDPYNAEITLLRADSSSGDVSPYALDGLSNGFKLRQAYDATNASGGTYIYAAFAETPFKVSLAR